MGKHVSDGEKLLNAMLNHKEMELALTKKELKDLQRKVNLYQSYIAELKCNNNQLCRQVNYLVHKCIKEDVAL